MTDAQWLIDSARSHLNDVAADVERHFDSVASQLRDFLSTDTPFSPRVLRPPPPPPTVYERCASWVSRHRAITAAIVAFAVTGSVGSVLFLHSARKSKKRRAGRSTSGARTDVVVLAGAVTSPLASNLALDLERRGYIVYSVISQPSQEAFVRGLQRADVLSLPLDLTDAYAAAEQMARFKALLQKEHSAFETAEPHRLSLKGLVLVPETDSVPTGQIDEISSEDWSDALNAKVLHTIATTQLFLPLLKEQSAKILLLTPSITPPLRLGGHSVENTVTAALEAFFATLSQEIKTSGTTISQFKLGSLDIPSITAKQRREGGPRIRAPPLRVLHDSVFDALAARRPASTWYIGRGSFTYSLVGRFAPSGLVSWIVELGERRRKAHRNTTQRDTLALEGSSTWEKVDGNDRV